ncbi:TPA_asm: tricarballylate utilization LysR family transcriptional regulator TcuR [Salmonella enterica subsp. salamae serovar 60:g,m,t:z6]|uniref:Tricarballylate utilization LysR family transcriptional regulator TcuR n=1 Tax=Salmonella enterica subsp. houtenae serovar 1,40:z4,z32:- TaxID=1967604 RepID=A0A730WLH8_SALHO|nr:tricarballylate utilization LysR family transcriptional regulator TcuR [Salmonella enterica]HAC6698243.1 tricarballylate utilization LysR family transcriptional regulator TcuR [Salmonella bongori serovar 66:z65:-]HAE2267039.1 tricarballylate utilization LysR family transcriptional regulator TcuR [Salmonella enterica subsp. enterica serovar 1,9,12:-:-]HAE4189376.1 tricarballylate utilization LysR family transcriptional regulator TcuR [Salmonella enterica subsp. houtenae serovar 1,40:z4,z32:-]
MELRQLRYFVRIIETGSMGSAAQDLDIGVSALSQQMSRLENELAIRLLQRTSRGVTPTNAGLAFYSQAQLALRHADDAILAAREARLSGHVSVGMAPSTASILGIPFIHAMQENYADVRLHVVESLSGNLERMINTRQIDLAVVFQKDKILRWSARPILEEQLFLIGSHALLAALPDNPITPEQLAGIPLIMPSQGHGLRGRLDAVCQEHALNVEIVAEIDGLALLMRAVRDGLGATLQPGAAISHLDNDALRVIGVHNPVLSRPNFLVSLSDDELTPAGLAARVVLTKVMRQLVDADEWPGATLYAF